MFKAFLDAASEADYKINPDMNGEYQEGFGMFDTTIHKGERASVSRHYLNPAKQRKNLNIFSNSYVEKIIFDGKKAIGIEVKIKNKLEKIYAEKETNFKRRINKLTSFINAIWCWRCKSFKRKRNKCSS